MTSTGVFIRLFVIQIVYTCYVSGQHLINDFAYINNTEPLSEVVLQYQAYCPNVPLCTVPHVMTGRVRNDRCCMNCSCSRKCYNDGSCCPDILKYFTERVSRVCVLPQYLQYGVTEVNTDTSVYMTHRCLSGFVDAQLKDKCEIIPDIATTLDEFVRTIPVSTINSGIVYRNYYCGICNGELKERLVKWDAQLVCDTRTDVRPNSFAELIHAINDVKRCNFVFKRPEHMHVPRDCKWGRVTRCNQTGSMTYYDEKLNNQCASFTSLFDFEYRNVFCYMCNRVTSPHHERCLFRIAPVSVNFASFTAILDFRTINHRESHELDHHKCSPTQRYDKFKGVCRDITCSSGLFYVNGECKRQLFSSQKLKSYEMYLKGIPVSTKKKVCISNMHQFGYELQRQIRSMFNISSNLTSDLCTISYLLRTGEHVCGNGSTPLQYVLIHIEAFSESIHSVDQYMTELSSFDHKDIFVVDTNTNQVSSMLLRFKMTIDAHAFGNIRFNSKLAYRTYIDPSTGEKLIAIPSKPEVKRTCEDIRRTRVIPIVYCPRVVLNASGYNVTHMDDTVCLDGRNQCVEYGRYDETEHGYDICADAYLGHITDEQTFDSCKSSADNTPYLFSLLTVICVSLSMCSLLLTILTYLLFRSLRTTPGINNMLLSINLLFAQGLFQFGTGQNSLGVGCDVIGILVHYFWLSAIVWMNICSIHMFRVFASDGFHQFHSGHNLIYYMVYGTVAPLFPVSANILVSLVTSDWSDIGYGGCLCYISSPIMVMYTFAIPVGILILVNIIMFIVVVVSICRSHDKKLSSNHDNISITVYGKLSCLTGASWIFGFLYSWTNIIIFGYIFITLSAGQGLFIFWAFIFSKRVMLLYAGSVKSKDSDSTKTMHSTHTIRTNLSSGTHAHDPTIPMIDIGQR